MREPPQAVARGDDEVRVARRKLPGDGHHRLTDDLANRVIRQTRPSLVGVLPIAGRTQRAILDLPLSVPRLLTVSRIKDPSDNMAAPELLTPIDITLGTPRAQYGVGE